MRSSWVKSSRNCWLASRVASGPKGGAPHVSNSSQRQVRGGRQVPPLSFSDHLLCEVLGLVFSWLVINRKDHRQWMDYSAFPISELEKMKENKFICAVLHYRQTVLLPFVMFVKLLKKYRKLHDPVHWAFPPSCSSMLSYRSHAGCVPTEGSMVGTGLIGLVEF